MKFIKYNDVVINLEHVSFFNLEKNTIIFHVGDIYKKFMFENPTEAKQYYEHLEHIAKVQQLEKGVAPAAGVVDL